TAMAQAPLTEAQMLKYTNKTSEAIIGAKAETNIVLTTKAGAFKQTISHPDASYIKLHFKDLDLKGGGKLIVRNLDSSERYEYTLANMNKATLDTEAGDNGVSSFSAMSISSDTVVVEYTAGTSKQAPIIDHYYYGT
ncbi:hypothetical protein CWC05_23825, partial [Pseudoalteromonas ruthenica]